MKTGTAEDGILKKTVNTGIYSNWNYSETKDWVKFNGMYTANYDGDGILKSTSAKYKMGPSGKEYKFKVTKKNGKVTKVVRSRWETVDGKGAWVDQAKIVFKYGKVKTDKQRYSLMVNAHIMETDNTYYIYNWY